MADFPTPFLYTSGKEGGGGHSSLEIRGSREGLQNIFPSLRAWVWSKNKGGQAPRAPPLDPPLPKLEKDIPFGRSLLV